MHTLRQLSLLAAACLWAVLSNGCSNAKPRQEAAQTAACRALAGFADGRDVTPALLACVASLPPGGEIALQPGRYVLRSRAVLDRAVYLHTANITQPCAPGNSSRCAMLVLAPGPNDRSALLAIGSAGTRIESVIFSGTKRFEPANAAAACSREGWHPAGGGLQVHGDRIAFVHAVFQDFTCYTALEYGAGTGARFIGNIFSGNGSHDASLHWSDGLTIHDGKQLVVEDNMFIDNTDVQLIFGGCQQCVVRGNRFRHNDRPEGGSFAELMAHAWPNGATSGDFTGSTISRNDIDCLPSHRCGFGLMIGASPWYKAPTFGGTVRQNRVANAMIGMNVNDLTGPMTIEANHVSGSGGTFAATCGKRAMAGVNISPASRRWVNAASVTDQPGAGSGSISFEGCLLNHPLAR